MILQYDGTNYAGWQWQDNAVSIQQKVSEAAEIILKEKINLTGSGRTDAGVHALGQTANFKTEKSLDLYKFNYQVNSILPEDISIIGSEEIDEEFNSRYDAKERSYLYLICGFKSPFYSRYSWYLNRKLDIEKLNLLSRELLGKRDYSSFCKTSSPVQNKICEVRRISWSSRNNILYFQIAADRFLHGMVRTILGTTLEALKQKDPCSYISGVFENKNRASAGESVPAKGLFLYKVKY